MKRILSGIILILSLTGMLIGVPKVVPAEASFIMVPDDYLTIQEAVDAASSGDTIFVKTGTYYENVIVNKTVVLTGENVDTTIVHGDGVGEVIQVNAASVAITGFTVENGKESWHGGIALHRCSDSTISRNRLTYNWGGIWLMDCTNTSITDNSMENNEFGIAGTGCSNCTITRNHATRNKHGIGFDECSSTNVIGNSLLNNQYCGFVSDYPYGNNRIVSNNIAGNLEGIVLNFYPNTNATGNAIIGNNITNNQYGISLYHSFDCNVADSNLASNGVGIRLHESKNNHIYHNNFANNSISVYAENSLIVWDDGYPSGGNYWSNHKNTDVKKGLEQNQHGSDGISDTAYEIYANNIDRYPFARPRGSLTPPTHTLTTVSTIGGTTTPPSGTYTYSQGQKVPVQANSDIGYVFHHWELDSFNVGASTLLSVTVDRDHNLKAVFSLGTYAVAVKAHCNVDDLNVEVDISMDGLPTGFKTPCTFSSLTGTHTFTVPQWDSNGHSFRQWDIGENNTAITVSAGGTLTASYDLRYSLSITSTVGGTTNPPSATYSHWSGTIIDTVAVPNVGYYLDYWQLNDANIGAPDHASIEMNANYSLQAVFTHLSSGHDVSVKYVDLKPVVGQGYSLTIKAKAMNVGGFTEAFNITIYINASSIASQAITLESGSSAIISFKWNTTGFNEGNYTVSAYAQPVPGEEDTADNLYKNVSAAVAMIGDINADGKVDLKDVFTVGKAYGSSPSHPRWIAVCDINNDEKVDLKDYYATCKNYGKTESEFPSSDLIVTYSLQAF